MPLSPRRQLEAVIRHDGRYIARCLIRRGRYMIGQDRKNEIVVDEESMSSCHARLTVVTDDEMYIEDNESANGVFVDGEPVHGMTPITVNSDVMLGKNALQFERGGIPAAVFEHLPEGFLRPGRYNLGEAVVQGRTSTIFEAHDTSLARDVALKAMLADSQAATSHVLRFVREAQITSQLQHPGIPPVYELGVDEQSRLFYTTRFVEGETLAGLLDEIKSGEGTAREQFTFARLISIFQKLCDTVAFAHSRGVLHTAIRPEHVVVGTFGEVFLTTWGTAKVLDPAVDEEGHPAFRKVHAPEPVVQAGLSPYSAPEQATDSFEQIELRTDVYALGGILYRILFLQDSVHGDDQEQLLSNILLGHHTAPATFVKTAMPHWPHGRLPEFLAAIAMKALSSNPDDRPGSVSEIRQQIEAWQDGTTSGSDVGKLFKGVAGFLGKH